MYSRMGEKLSLRILMDKFTLEVFVNGGEQAMSTLIYTRLQADGIVSPVTVRQFFP